MWPHGWCVMWLCRCDFTILSHYPAKFGSVGLVKVEICFWFVTWPRGWSVTWLCGWSPLILSHHPAKFGVHRPYGTGNNGICNISSNSNAEVPMPRFTNGLPRHCNNTVCLFVKTDCHMSQQLWVYSSFIYSFDLCIA